MRQIERGNDENASHATGPSKVPQSLQEAVPKGVEEALPDSVSLFATKDHQKRD